MADPSRSLLATPLVIAVAVLAGSAYGGSGSPSGVRAPGGDLALRPEAVAVTMTDQVTFEPAAMTVKVGQTVEWRNPSRLVHTVTADPEKAAVPEHVQLPEGAEPFDSGVVRPGETYRRTFTVPGTYRYLCIPHEAAGMVAEIVVQDG